MTRREAIEYAARTLAHASPTAQLDAEVLLAHVCGAPRAGIYTRGDLALANIVETRFRELLARRVGGEPVAYLTGHREFWSLDLEVSPATLIPRPETETLVECALAHIPPSASWSVADLGTGCGAIALALASERPKLRITATDSSNAALDVARANARLLGLSHVEFLLGDWFAPLGARRFDVIVSNPPYVATDDPHLERGDVRFEPRAALVAGADGLDAIRQIIIGAGSRLLPDGRLLLEHGFDQGSAVRVLLAAAGFREPVSHKDLSGHERVTAAVAPID